MRSLILASLLSLASTAAVTHAAGGGFVRMYVRHEVADYDAWKKVYDDLAATRDTMGVMAQAVYRSAQNLNDITVTHDFKTLERARAFAASAVLKAAMQKAGVTGTPEIWFTMLADGRAAESEGVRMYVRHEVADYTAWRKTYDEFAPQRRRMGVTDQAVRRSADDPNDLTVTHDFKSVELANTFASSPELRAAMEKAGVRGAPRIWFTLRAAR